MSKHTAGPWRARRATVTSAAGQRKEWQVVTYEALPRTIAIIQEDDWPEPNARLIAAAPRLLEAAKGAIAALSQNKTHPADIAAAKAFLASAIEATRATA